MEDMILPEGFEVPQPQGTESAETEVETSDTGTETQETGEDTKPLVTEEQPPEVNQTPQKIKVKFNHEERELDVEEAAQLAQKGMVFDKAVERARQEAAQQARDSVIAEMGMFDYDGNPITTEQHYRDVLREKEFREKYNDIPDELRKELLESRRDREERQREKAEKEQQAKKQAEFADFFQYFKSVNGADFDPDKDSIPPEVQKAVEGGQSLKIAYMEHHNKQLLNQLKILQQNQANKNKAPIGAVTANGGKPPVSDDLFLKGFNSV